MTQKPNIRDVAKLAGVSTATVSRTLAQPAMVKEETRRRVMSAVEAMGFVPNSSARVLRTQTSKTVILLVRDISNPFYLDIYKGVEEAAFEAGYKVLMGDARDDDVRIEHYIDTVRERHADGMILMIGHLPEKLITGAAKLPPIVVALEAIENLELPTVRVDNVAAARKAVRHLVDLGHRRIAHITGPLDEYLGKARLEGYRRALEEAGIAFDPDLVLAGDFSLVVGHNQTERLLDRRIPFTAIFAASDQMAIGAVTALRSRSLTIPDNVSVVGFDDTLMASMIDPALTTIHQPRREIGRAAMGLMIERLTKAGTPADRCFPTELVVRGSTGPCAATVSP
ncbi:HTH-type transcriptional repressor CytR [Hartmannibacter diazotrophicus]|uniref:HTH-type transcriptional repressor CytR n=2 Tax=Hartmannibacter diazotrophicus TaxID=1482074 RepID=A0A2C9D559_9HYPH|nr:LacI family DNA-binding transcriptional regulator [Hartmannibacter diazotrophicus]SON55278.1 HTH-type transcriptional repressor CytR [Hartmannibacter diazotrophicus]